MISNLTNRDYNTADKPCQIFFIHFIKIILSSDIIFVYFHAVYNFYSKKGCKIDGINLTSLVFMHFPVSRGLFSKGIVLLNLLFHIQYVLLEHFHGPLRIMFYQGLNDFPVIKAVGFCVFFSGCLEILGNIRTGFLKGCGNHIAYITVPAHLTELQMKIRVPVPMNGHHPLMVILCDGIQLS